MSVRIKLKDDDAKGSLTLVDAKGESTILTKGRSVLVSDEVYERVRNFCVAVVSEWRVLRKQFLKVWVPDGIGDIHWCFLKLGSLVKNCGADGVDLYIRDLSPARPRRAEEFVRMNPLVRNVSFVSKLFYLPQEGVLVEEEGYDYVLDPTDLLEAGQEINKWMPSLETDFEYPLKYESPNSVYPDRVVLCFGNESSERAWGSGWNVADWAFLVRVLSKKFSVWAVGLDCDLAYSKKVAEAGCVFVSRVGDTSLKDALDLITTSKLFVSSISGLPILSAFLRHPTVAIWPGSSAVEPLPSQVRFSWVGDRPDYVATSFEYGSREVAKTCLKVML